MKIGEECIEGMRKEAIEYKIEVGGEWGII
jgi:hypothetical protein